MEWKPKCWKMNEENQKYGQTKYVQQNQNAPEQRQQTEPYICKNMCLCQYLPTLKICSTCSSV